MAHQHQLISVQNSTRGKWYCDFCMRNGKNLNEEFSYRCRSCSFDLCLDCNQPRYHPGHEHQLRVVDVSCIGNSWSCDICKRDKTEEKLSRHCGECNFDVCRDCFKHHITSLHQHVLLKACAVDVYPKSRGSWKCHNCHSTFNNPNENWPWHCHECEYDLCDQCASANPRKRTDAADNVEELVTPHLLKGFTSLENFVWILNSAPVASEISARAAQHLMVRLLEPVKGAYEHFCLADSAMDKINSEAENELQNVLVQEKIIVDRLHQTEQRLAKLRENMEVLRQEYDEAKQQLNNEESKLETARESLRERYRQLEKAEKDRKGGTLASGAIGLMLFGPFGAAAGVATGYAVGSHNVSNAEQSVDEASSRVAHIKGRVDNKEVELSNLIDETAQGGQRKIQESQELEFLRAKKAEIKESRKRLANLSVPIKSCTFLVNVTTARAKMMADEANGQLPDIEAILPPLKAIAEDLSDVALSNCKLLSGRFKIKQVGFKIQAITSKAMKSSTSDDLDL